TESGRGILFGNPHYPWHGPSRFHVIHTTIPGELDSMGASLLVTNFIAIGFNRDIAWTHTVSTALRYTLYELELNAVDPLEYRYGDEYRPIAPMPVSVSVRGDDGAMSSLERTVYLTHYGPVVVSEQLPWTAAKAYAVRDAVIDNDASTATYTALNTATSIDDVEAAISLQGVYWTNTIAADRDGNAYYADISGTPNVDAAALEKCRIMAARIPEHVVLLNGAEPGCEWKTDPRARVPGTLPAGEMPRIRRDDYVTNSNDSYWLANPQAPLEGYLPIIGSERSPRSLRTRAGLTLVQEALARDQRLEPADVQAMLYSHRNHGAELLLDDVLKICGDDDLVVPVDGADIDIGASCRVLSAWDRTANIGSRGVQVWTEFWRTANRIDGLYAVPFDPADPVRTPRGIAVDDAEVVDALKEALARGQKTLADAGIPLDAPWGEVQFTERRGEDIPVPGAPGWSGMFSYIVAGLNKDKGYTPIIAGNSYIQVVSWDAAGELDARGMLTYSQSPEADSPHYADLTRLYSRGEWIRLPFTEEEILADPNLRTLTLRGN
ncbi:MAG: penicillin acylase family protein, partial [Woeseiaceae bacterium]